MPTKKILFAFTNLLLSNICLSMELPRLLLIDTANRPAQAYSGLSSLCAQAGFLVDYAHSHDPKIQTANTYDVAVLMTDSDTCDQFFGLSNLNHPNLKYFLEKRPYKVLGFLLPTDLSEEANNLLSDQPIDGLKNFLKRLSIYSQSYDTALLFKKSQPAQAQLSSGSTTSTITLPIGSTNPLILFQRLDSTTPPQFFSRMGLLNFYELSEEQRISPIKRSIREELLKNTLQALFELRALCSNQTIPQTSNLALPKQLTEDYEQECFAQVRALRAQTMRPHYSWIHKQGIYAGWMDLDPLMQTSETLDCGVNAIADAHLNLLWLRLNPEQYLSDQIIEYEFMNMHSSSFYGYTDNLARLMKEKEQWLNKIQKFTKALEKTCVQKKQKTPGIMVNFDITTNFRVVKATTTAHDFYGKEHKSVPTPLDYENFWRTELVRPFQEFVRLWQNEAGSGLPLAGIFLDLQMYHSPNKDDATLYNNFLDFSDHSWQVYCSYTQDPTLSTITTALSRVYYLTDNNLLEDYFACLQIVAFELGKKIREQLRESVPNLYIGVYQGAGLPEDWFHLGFLAGLSTPEDPIILASFNSNAYSHMDYLLENNIHCFHITSMLMSKFQEESDFELINERRKYNDGLWFSRFSHLAKGRPQDSDWWRLEASLLPRDRIISQLQSYSNVIEQN